CCNEMSRVTKGSFCANSELQTNWQRTFTVTNHMDRFDPLKTLVTHVQSPAVDPRCGTMGMGSCGRRHLANGTRAAVSRLQAGSRVSLERGGAGAQSGPAPASLRGIDHAAGHLVMCGALGLATDSCGR